MSRETYRRVKRLLARTLPIDETRIRPESTLVGDLGAKSVDVIEVILALEEEFQVDIPDCDITPEPFDLTTEMTVHDLADLLDEHRK